MGAMGVDRPADVSPGQAGHRTPLRGVSVSVRGQPDKCPECPACPVHSEQFHEEKSELADELRRIAQEFTTALIPAHNLKGE
jgi:hypothetical protein